MLVALLASLGRGLTWANPMRLQYRFTTTSPSRREAADPNFVNFNGEYYLFASRCGGYFHSTDLVHWTLIPVTRGAMYDLLESYAPAAVVIDNAIYFITSNHKTVIKSTTPKDANSWTVVTNSFPYDKTDPALFLDEDGRLYYYGGCSDSAPIYGGEINPKTFGAIGSLKELVRNNQANWGFERMGDYAAGDGRSPWIEGSFMNRFGGKYYLQVANPGTSYKCYNDAVYESSSPLGPFTPAKHNPFSYMPEGFIAAAGHGSTILDKYGNIWHIATQAIAVRNNMERRLGLFPSFLDSDGTLHAYTGFGDWPKKMPTKRFSSPDDIAVDWYLLSYGRQTLPSSTYGDHRSAYAVDEDVRKWWSASTGNAGESLEIKLGALSTIYAVQLNFADEGSSQLGRPTGFFYQYRVEVSKDEKEWTVVVDKSANNEDLCHDYIELEKPAEGQFIRVVNVKCPTGVKFSLYGFRVFGKQDKAKPAEPKLTVKRGSDARDADLTWTAVADAVGYNIKFGTIEGKLYHNYIVYGGTTTKLTIHALIKNDKYFWAIDAFNEGGITRGATVVTA